MTAVVVVAMLLFGRHARAQSGSLDQVRQEVRQPADESPEPARPEEPDESDEDRRRFARAQEENGNFWGELIQPVFGAALVGVGAGVTAPFWGPPVWVEDHYSFSARFADFPYQDDLRGYMHLPAGRSHAKSWSLRVRSEYAYDFADMQRIGGQVLWESASRFGVDATTDYRSEELGHEAHDELWMGDANLVFRFAQCEWLTMRTGLGLNWLSDDVSNDYGFNFTYAGDLFPVKPWILSSELDAGTLGDAWLLHLRTTAGFNFRHAEFFLGYDWTRVDQVDLGGWVSGVRLWY
jgi:hypothetical protein